MAQQHAVAQRVFQQAQATAAQQFGVAIDLGHQALLRRYGQHLLRPHAQGFSDPDLLAIDLILDLLRRAELVPQGVDLVEHHQARIGAGAL